MHTPRKNRQLASKERLTASRLPYGAPSELKPIAHYAQAVAPILGPVSVSLRVSGAIENGAKRIGGFADRSISFNASPVPKSGGRGIFLARLCRQFPRYHARPLHRTLMRCIRTPALGITLVAISEGVSGRHSQYEVAASVHASSLSVFSLLASYLCKGDLQVGMDAGTIAK